MVAPFRLVAGDHAPVQQTSTTCGSASLTVARMLANPMFAQWIRDGIRKDARDGDVPDGGTEAQRFAAYEQVVASRTNAVVGAGRRLQLPWPRALGTPPWGALNELEYGAADPEADYDLAWFRQRGRVGLRHTYAALRARVRPGRPALLYVGNAWAPRHVVLVLPPTGEQELDVYEPSVGRVVDLPEHAFVERRLAIAGWDVPWAAVWADPHP
ncbi:hypothetical protein ASE25_19970 [Terrabacter sp. Root85]|uniref:hypothetical protein n=1 Tax=unclassified Terrabacter TaxID=2630222 RepID=UPI0006F4AFFA|nr:MULTISPECIES: hypothetical protein [unclassified Terrabacter]KRC85313.1 hypothetical protein ASE25_19970 [Terrabacter sp. Root85]KRF44477.1 hypothetical protein ASH01_10735 [Terrabacter sp. Soil811]